MTRRRTQRKLAAAIARGPATDLRFKLGTIATVSVVDGLTVCTVTVGADTVPSPFLATYSPVVADLVAVLLFSSSPLILGPVVTGVVESGGATEPIVAYTPPTDRLAVGYSGFSVATPPATGTFIPAWSFTEDAAGASVQLRPVDDGGVYLFAAGVYAVHMWLKVAGMGLADPTCSVRLQCDVSDPFSTSFDCGLRGGDGDATHAPFASTSRIYFDPGNGLSGGLSFKIDHQNFDSVNITSVVAEVHVQRIS